jgi:hypothetical protein
MDGVVTLIFRFKQSKKILNCTFLTLAVDGDVSSTLNLGKETFPV